MMVTLPVKVLFPDKVTVLPEVFALTETEPAPEIFCAKVVVALGDNFNVAPLDTATSPKLTGKVGMDWLPSVKVPPATVNGAVSPALVDNRFKAPPPALVKPVELTMLFEKVVCWLLVTLFTVSVLAVLPAS